jgi:hypothetical protein
MIPPPQKAPAGALRNTCQPVAAGSPDVRTDLSAHAASVRECLLCILDEEWEHRLYAERDLDALEARGS